MKLKVWPPLNTAYQLITATWMTTNHFSINDALSSAVEDYDGKFINSAASMRQSASAEVTLRTMRV
jgi:hypothetical protein